MPKLRAASLRNVLLIARREYLERIRTRGFLITTVMIPLIMGGFIFGSIFLGSKAPGDIHIAVVSSDTQLALDLQAELERRQQQQEDSAALRRVIRPAESSEEAAAHHRRRHGRRAPARARNWRATWNPATSMATSGSRRPPRPGGRPTFAFTPAVERPGARSRTRLPTALGTGAHPRATGPSRRRGRRSRHHAAARRHRHRPRRPHHEDHESAEISVSVLFFLMYMVIMLYGMNVARSIIEEKTSRIFEVLLATIRPEAMMAGKIIGVGSVGLTQVGIWLAAVLLLAASAIGIHLGGDTLHIALTAPQVVFFFIYFILGYAFYSSIAAALGAMTNSEQELQQLNMFLVLPLLFCFVMLGTLLTTPDSTLARILALIPPFTPLLMYLRVSLGHPAPWEVVLSIVLTSASIYGIIWVTSRIYRVGVLMYGKRPNLPEILRWLKYS